MTGRFNSGPFGFYRECAARRLHGLRMAFDRGEVKAAAVRSAALDARRIGVDEAAIAEDMCGIGEIERDGAVWTRNGGDTTRVC